MQSRNPSDLHISREPHNHYGSLEPMVRAIRARRPLDLNAERWRQNNPQAAFETWQRQARQCLFDGLHCDSGPVDLQAEVLSREERPDFTLERVAFNTTPWSRVNGYFLLPQNLNQPVPGLVVFHAWGGPMLFGKERIVNTGRDHPLLEAHRAEYYSGRYLAEEFAQAGYAVIVIDAHHFGQRAPRNLDAIPAAYDPFELSIDAYNALDTQVREALYLGVRQLN
jgi:hypothetical protein